MSSKDVSMDESVIEDSTTMASKDVSMDESVIEDSFAGSEISVMDISVWNGISESLLEDSFAGSEITSSPNDKSIEGAVAYNLPNDESSYKPASQLYHSCIEISSSSSDLSEETNEINKPEISNHINVTRSEYNDLKLRIEGNQIKLAEIKSLLDNVDLSKLPDKGETLRAGNNQLEQSLQDEMRKFERMVIIHEESVAGVENKLKVASWDQLEVASFSRKALATYNLQKNLTTDCLEQLHESIKNCPDENIVSEDPEGLRTSLMEHQKQALTWLTWRESQKPSGGILADDMGLGKTLTMISLMLTSKHHETKQSDKENDSNEKRYKGGTLVVCPANLLAQWQQEVKNHVKPNLMAVELYHGSKRETSYKRLASYDLVITTYNIILHEAQKDTPINTIFWQRVILDEAHQIRNHKSNTSMAIFDLTSKSRWALTGTPIQNKELDLYAILKFLKCSPFDDLSVWKRWIDDKTEGGQERLNTVISSLMLRRTKKQLQLNGRLNSLPERSFELIEIKFEKAEESVHNKLLLFSRSLFANFLREREEKIGGHYTLPGSIDDQADYNRMYEAILKRNNVKQIKQHHILVLLLRLRQICVHPHLIFKMLESTDDVGQSNDDEPDDLDLSRHLNLVTLNDDVNDTPCQSVAVGLTEATRELLNPSNPIFDRNYTSSKFKAALRVLKEKVLPTNDKAIVVSQWAGLLNLLGTHLKNNNIKFDVLDGSIPVHERLGIIDKINCSSNDTRILLLSLTAGGVGLNLIGANHLLLLDLHWNPQLERQAQDRIYRVGQKKEVYIYKFMVSDTIEEKVKLLQDRKLETADSILTGAKVQNNQLTLDELKILFR